MCLMISVEVFCILSCFFFFGKCCTIWCFVWPFDLSTEIPTPSFKFSHSYVWSFFPVWRCCVRAELAPSYSDPRYSIIAFCLKCMFSELNCRQKRYQCKTWPRFPCPIISWLSSEFPTSCHMPRHSLATRWFDEAVWWMHISGHFWSSFYGTLRRNFSS